MTGFHGRSNWRGKKKKKTSSIEVVKGAMDVVSISITLLPRVSDDEDNTFLSTLAAKNDEVPLFSRSFSPSHVMCEQCMAKPSVAALILIP